MKATLNCSTNEFIAYLENNKERLCDEMNKARQTIEANIPRKEFDSAVEHTFHQWNGFGSGGKCELTSFMTKSFSQIDNFVREGGFNYTVLRQTDDFSVLFYGKKGNHFVAPNMFVDFIPEPDTSGYTLRELRIQAGLSNDGDASMVLAGAGQQLIDSSVQDIKGAQADVKEKLHILADEMDAVKNATHDELAELKIKLDAITQEMNNKKTELMAELNRKKSEMELMVKDLEGKLYVLSSEIYSIRCFMGETIDILKLRDGMKAPKAEPVFLNQKIIFLDEELGKLVSLYAQDLSLKSYTLVEDVLKRCDLVLDSFCPQEKCISFMRVSRTGTILGLMDKVDLLENYEMLHGTKLGIIIRDGEQVYVGWTEEEYININVDDNMFYRPGTETIPLEEGENIKEPSEEEKWKIMRNMVSRMFCISILQGLSERTSIISLPEKVDFRFPSKYVIYNYSEGLLEDNRFGDFAALVNNLNKRKVVGDDIMVILNLAEHDDKRNGGTRGRGYANRTHDCDVDSGLNKINLIDDEGVYVSALKQSSYGSGVARSNFSLSRNEYVNLTYFNTVWMEYYIVTKRVGNLGLVYNSYSSKSADYPYLVRFYKIALQFLREREAKEKALIEKHYPSLDRVFEWPVVLSHWKLYKGVREITDFQAKRFAKYLDSGNIVTLTNLFAPDFNKKELTFLNLERWAETKLTDYNTRSSVYVGDEDGIRDPDFGGEFKQWPFDKKLGENIPATPYALKEFNMDTPNDEILKRVLLDAEKLRRISVAVKQNAEDLGFEASDVYKKLKEYLEQAKMGPEKRVFVHSINKNTLAPISPAEMDSKTLETIKEACSLRYANKTVAVDLWQLRYYQRLQREIYRFLIGFLSDLVIERYENATEPATLQYV